jgi:ATP-GRASP peptide maturase of grasp-with-spasm system
VILIISQRNHDPSTLEVQEWLNYYNADYVRINGIDLLENFQYTSHSSFLPEGKKDKVNIVWFRRWLDESLGEKMSLHEFPQDIELSNQNLLKYYEYIQGEIRVLNAVFFRSFQDKYWLSHPRDLQVDKINVLEIAKNIGLNVPEYLITNSKDELLKFKGKYDLISKNLREVQYFTSNNREYVSCTKTVEVDSEFISKLDRLFFPSFFQRMIPKEYELRVFFLGTDFFPMAIFSQLDEKTKVDFRNYNLKKPNRCVPYHLETDLKTKLINLASALKLETGSIDLIKSTDGEYYFLEVNPIGQFGMTSSPCNYQIEKKLAKYLIHKDQEIENEKRKSLESSNYNKINKRGL